MKLKIVTTCLVAATLAAGTAVASAQGGSTDRNGNANGSEYVGNGGYNGSVVVPGATGTTGMSSGTIRSERDSPNGSPNTAPKANSGPQGDPSKDESTQR